MSWLPEKEEFEETMRRERERNRPMEQKPEPKKERKPHWSDAIPSVHRIFWTGH